MIRNVLVLFSGNVFTQILSFLSGLIVIRMLTVQQYGEYSTITGFVNMITLPLAGFFSLAIRRYLPIYTREGRHDLTSGLIRLSLMYAAGLSTVLLLIFLMGGDWISSRVLRGVHREYLLLYAALVPLMVFNSPLSATMLGLERFRAYTLAVNIMPNSFRFLHLVLWWLLIPFKMLGAILSLITKSASTLMATLYLLRKDLGALLSEKPSYRVGEWVRFSLPNALRFVVSYTAQNIGVILLGTTRHLSDAGIFRASSILVMGVHNITLAFSSALLPRLSREVVSGGGVDTTGRVSFMNLSAASLMIFPFILAGEWILGFLGPDYIRGYPVLLIMSLMLLMEAWTSAWQGYIIARGRTDLNLITYSISSTTSILASYLLIRSMGLYGAAWALVIESSLNALFRGMWMLRISGKLPIDIRQVLLILLMTGLIVFRLWRI